MFKFRLFTFALLLTFVVSACSSAPTPTPTATPLPTAAPTNTAIPAPTVTPPPTVAPPEIVCGSPRKDPVVVSLSNRGDISLLLPHVATVGPQRFDHVTDQGAQIVLALNGEASSNPLITGSSNFVACFATYGGDVSPLIMVVNKETKFVSTMVYDPATSRFISAFDQRIIGDKIFNKDETGAVPFSVELKRANGQPMIGFNLLTYVDKRTGELSAIYDIAQAKFYTGKDLAYYESQLTNLPFVADLPDSFPDQLKAMYGDNVDLAKTIKSWSYVRQNGSDSLTPIATTADSKLVQPIPDKTWSSIQARIEQIKKAQGSNGNGENGVAFSFSWNGDAQKPQYAIFSEKVNGAHEVTYYPPGVQNPVKFSVPEGAKNWGLDYKLNQPYYTAATGTVMYFGKDSGMWYSKPGVDLVPTDPKILANPELLQQEIDRVVDGLEIDTGNHDEMIVDYTNFTAQLLRTVNGRNIYGHKFTGGRKTNTVAEVKQALQENLKYYLTGNSVVPPSNLKTTSLSEIIDILAILRLNFWATNASSQTP